MSGEWGTDAWGEGPWAGEGSPPAPLVSSASASAESNATTTNPLVTPGASVVASGDSNAAVLASATAIINAGVRTNRAGGRNREGVGTASWSPPVVPPPAEYAHVQARVHALAFTYGGQHPAAPSQPVLSNVHRAELPAQRDRIVIGGTDVTYLRGVPTPFPGFALEEPFMYASTTIAFPQIAATFEKLGAGQLRWARKGKTVEIQRVDVATEQVVATDYVGVVIDTDVSGAVPSLTIGGEAMGRLALANRQVPIWTSFQDIGRYVYSAFKEVGLQLKPYLGPETGVRLQRFGGQSMLDYVNELLARSYNRQGTPWTVMPTAKRGIYRMHRKDTDTVHGTVYALDAGTTADLHRGASEEPNRIFMTGVSPAGERIRFGVYPGLKQSPPPPYPYTNHNHAFGPGTTDGATDTGDGITLMIQRLIITKYLDQEDTPGGYDQQVARAIRNLQEDAGRSFINGVMDYQTWQALWDLDVTGYSLRWSHIEPAAQLAKVRKWNRSGSGAVIGRNDRFDPTVLVVDRNIDVGSGFTRDQMREWAQAELTDPEDNWNGTITFGTGALVAGEHNPGDPLIPADLMYARDLRPGMNLVLPLWDGGDGIKVHVAAVTVGADGGVQAAVDTRARDAMQVWEVITRNRESRNSPARNWHRDHRSSTMTKDSMGVWDEVGGLLYQPIKLEANRWRVFPVVAGQEGTVARLHVRTDPHAEFVVGVFGDVIYPERLANYIGNPLTKRGSRHWTSEGRRDQLEDTNWLLYVAGDYSNPCGYYPKQKQDEGDATDDDGTPDTTAGTTPNPVFQEFAPLTGRWQDDAGFAYRTRQQPVLYVAIYADRATTIPAGRLMWNQLEAGV